MSTARNTTAGTAIIEVRHLVRRYKAVVAVDDISLRVATGEIFGLLGPNGAGKTSAIEVLEGLHPPDSGEVRLFGLDIVAHGRSIKQRIGVQLQTTGLPKFLTVRETLDLFGSFYDRRRAGRAQTGSSGHIDSLLERVGLTDKRQRLTSRLSGGERQRLALALALVNDPDLLFLDEPSSGLDPHGRRELWSIIREWQSEGNTVFLTTHDMREAESLCDRLAIMDRGRVVAEGRVTDLMDEHKDEQAIWVSWTDAGHGQPAAAEVAASLPEVAHVAWESDGALLYSMDAASTMTRLLELRRTGNLAFDAIELRPTSLEDVFLKLTGRRLDE